MHTEAVGFHSDFAVEKVGQLQNSVGLWDFCNSVVCTDTGVLSVQSVSGMTF